jgi:hypothetical protein
MLAARAGMPTRSTRPVIGEVDQWLAREIAPLVSGLTFNTATALEPYFRGGTGPAARW